MPKKTHIYRDFSGGENTSANPKIIGQNELQLVSGMFVDDMGYLTTLYPPQKSPDAAHLKDFGLLKSFIAGTSLFYFKSDYSYVSGGDWVAAGPYHYIVIVDRSVNDAESYISITDGSTLVRNALVLGGRNLIPDFYKHGNNIRMGDTAIETNSPVGQTWFGPIIGSAAGTKKIMGAEISKRWYSELNNLASPSYGVSGRVVGTGHGDSTTTSIVPVRVTDLAGTATVANNSGVVRFTKTSHGMVAGDTVIISDSEYYSGSHTVTDVDSADVFGISKTWLSVAAGETPEWRRKGNPDWFSGFTATIAAATSANKWFLSWANQSDDELRKCTVAAANDMTVSPAGTAFDDDAFEIYPYPGVGMNLDVYQSYGSDKGAWPPGDYEFGQTFVYNDDQESLISKMHGDNVTVDANEVLYCRVLFSGLNVTAAVPNTTGDGGNSDINPRIEKGRIYARKSGTGDEWILLVDCDLRTSNAAAGGGTRLNLTDSLDSWSTRAAVEESVTDISGNVDDTVARWRGFYSTQYTVKSPSPFTYEAINGFSQDEPVIDFGVAGLCYRTSVIANSRAFVANLDYYNTSGQQQDRMGDAIVYSPPNKVDTFPPSNRLDIAEGDGDEFISLMESGGKLLAFKESALYVIDITNPNPAGWRLENKLSGLGVSHTCSSIRVESGVAFANYHGCWIYDNNKLINLIQNKISVSQWQNFIGSPTNKPNIGYDSISRKLIIAHNNEDVSKYIKFYDFITKSWSRSHGDGTTGGKGFAVFMNYHTDFGLGDYDEANNCWSNFVTIPEATPNFTAGHGSKGGGAVVYVEEDNASTGDNLIAAHNVIFADASNWAEHKSAGTVSFTQSSTGAQHLEIAGDSDEGEQGAKLVDAYIDSGTDPVSGKTYMISADIWWITASGANLTDAIFFIQYAGTTTAGFKISTSQRTFHKYITASSTDNELQIYYTDASTTRWRIDNVYLMEVKADLRWFALKRNVIDYSNAIVDGDAKANRSLYNIVTREEDFGAPFNLKKIYAVTIDYITESSQSNAYRFTFDLGYQINGNIQSSDLGTDWMSAASVPLIVDNQSTVGLAVPNEVNTIRIPHTSFSATSNQPIKCHSIAFQIITNDGATRQFVKILNIGIEYRIIKKTVGTETTAADDATL